MLTLARRPSRGDGATERWPYRERDPRRTVSRSLHRLRRLAPRRTSSSPPRPARRWTSPPSSRAESAAADGAPVPRRARIAQRTPASPTSSTARRATPAPPKLRAIVADGYVPTRSELEDRALDGIAAAGIEAPRRQPAAGAATTAPSAQTCVWRGAPRRDRARRCRLARRTALTRADDADKQAILEAGGYRVLRITWRQLVDHPRQTHRPHRAALRNRAVAPPRRCG